MNYGWDAMDSRLEIAATDLVVSGTQELYSLCRARGIVLLIYFGGATNICLTGKDIGLGPMYAAGLNTVFIPYHTTWQHEIEEINPNGGETLVLESFAELAQHFTKELP